MDISKRMTFVECFFFRKLLKNRKKKTLFRSRNFLVQCSYLSIKMIVIIVGSFCSSCALNSSLIMFNNMVTWLSGDELISTVLQSLSEPAIFHIPDKHSKRLSYFQHLGLSLFIAYILKLLQYRLTAIMFSIIVQKTFKSAILLGQKLFFLGMQIK